MTVTSPLSYLLGKMVFSATVLECLGGWLAALLALSADVQNAHPAMLCY